jgi:lipopolysaccharide export system protein LptA
MHGVCSTNDVAISTNVVSNTDQFLDADERQWLLDQYDPNVTNTVVTADYMEYDHNKMNAELKKNVKIKDSRVYMESDLIRIFFYKNNSIKTISSIGNVKVVQGNKIAMADKALYFGKEGKILMLGNAVLLRDEEYMKGKRITFFMDNQRVICEPGMLVFRPGKYQGEDSSIISTNESALFDEFK